MGGGKNKKKKMVNKTGRMAAAEFPRPYVANLAGTKRFRFVESTASATTYSITPAKLGALIATCTVVNSQVAGWFEQIRVRSVEVWAPTPNNTAAVPQNVQVTFEGTVPGVIGDNVTHSDYSMGMTHNAHVKAVPAALSQAAEWQNTNINIATAQAIIFTITSPANTNIVVDVVLDWRVTRDDRGPGASGVTVAAGTLGHVYYMALDNAAGSTFSSSNLLLPDQSLVTTA